MSTAVNTLKRKMVKDTELDALFDYSRVAPTVELEDSDDEDVQIIDKIEVKTRRRFSTRPVQVVGDIQRPPATTVVKNIENDDDWLAPRSKVPVRVVQPADPHLLELRRQKQELLSLSVQMAAESAQLEAVARLTELEARAKLASDPAVTYSGDSPKGGGNQSTREKIVLQLQEQGGKIHPVKIFTDDKFEKLFTIFGQKIARRPVTDFIFRFDGAALDPQKTPKELELEDEDMVEVHLKSSQPGLRV